MPTRGDEGMWLFNQPPRKQLKERYGFDPTDTWLEHLQKSAVRFNSGGSGSFVSADGLVMTNHHVGADCLHKLSSADKDLVKIGFHAKTRDEEIKCVDLELNVLMGIEDVTDRVNAAVKPGMDAAAAQVARRAIRNTIEKESLDKTGLRSDVVTLFQGGRYNLYRYKKYTDVRLVFAPEKDIAFFGGDPDNFEYPRYDLDICFFRVYEDGKPIKPQHFLTLEQGRRRRRRADLRGRAPGPHRSAEHGGPSGFSARQGVSAAAQHAPPPRSAAEDLQRSRAGKRPPCSGRAVQLPEQPQSPAGRLGRFAGPGHHGSQAKGRARAAPGRGQRSRSCATRATPGTRSTTAIGSLGIRFTSTTSSTNAARHSTASCIMIARTLVRLADESAKPNPDRLREYAEAGLDSLKQQLFSEAPIYSDLETVKLADSLGYLIEQAGAENPLRQANHGRHVPGPTRQPTGFGHEAGRRRPFARSWPTAARPRSTAPTIR